MPVRMIQKAIASDAERLAELAERTFRETFGAENTPADLNSHCSANYGRDIQAAEIADPGMITLLSKKGDELVGYAQMRWPHAPACVIAEAPGEIQRLYVAKAWHGAGVAHELMNAAITEMLSRRTDVIWLGVWERNPRAIAFYKKFGFAEIGEHAFKLGSDLQRDIIMARSCYPIPPEMI